MTCTGESITGIAQMAGAIVTAFHVVASGIWAAAITLGRTFVNVYKMSNNCYLFLHTKHYY